jgi:hypothetical protein
MPDCQFRNSRWWGTTNKNYKISRNVYITKVFDVKCIVIPSNALVGARIAQSLQHLDYEVVRFLARESDVCVKRPRRIWGPPSRLFSRYLGFFRDKTARSWSWPLSAIYCRSDNSVDLHLHCPHSTSWCEQAQRNTFSFLRPPYW